MSSPFRLLLVEDDLSWRRALRSMYEGLLPRHEIEWAFATETDEAVCLLNHSSRPFDLISLDFLLEGTDGRTVLRIAKKLESCRAVIVITGFDQMAEFEAVVEDAYQRRVVKMTMQPYIQELFPERHLYLKKDLDLGIDENIEIFRNVLAAGRLLRLVGSDRVFTREGDTWKVVFGGKETRLAHRLGFSYLVILLEHPNTHFSCSELEERVYPALHPPADEIVGASRVLESGFHVDQPFFEEGVQPGRSRYDIEAELARFRSNFDLQAPMSDSVRDGLRARLEILEDELASLKKTKRKAVYDRVSANLRRAIDYLAEQRDLGDLVQHLRRHLTIGPQCVYYPPAEDRRWDVG